MGSTILTPLYPIYQQRFGFPELTVTLIYAVYVIGNLAVLCFFGRLSDQAVSAVTAILTRGLSARSAMVVTLVLLLIGLGLLTLAEATHSLSLLLIGTVATGAVLALAYRASLQIINEISPKGQRAEVLASFQIVHFVANSLPVIGVGLLALVISTPAAHRAFAIVLVVLAGLACAIGLRYIQRDSISRFTSH